MSELQTVIFSLNAQLYGAEASQVFQIIRYQGVTKVPRMPRFIEGVIDYRDSVLPVISLNKRFEMGNQTVTKKTKILVTKIGDKQAGFIVNDVSEIVRFTDEDIEPAPSLIYSESNSFFSKVGKKDDILVTIIDLKKVLNDNEVKRLNIKR
ncbi:MAG: purine-binding chemotaxis protein CheW [Ruminiclostridium sp.]|nr:purine-binding chemotaxis protein CheW [Ruminiclostridium sp.]